MGSHSTNTHAKYSSLPRASVVHGTAVHLPANMPATAKNSGMRRLRRVSLTSRSTLTS